MTDGIMLGPGEGRRIVGGALDATVKSTMDAPALTSSFEMVIPAGYDVGAHVHAHGEEVFYVVEGELDLLAFEPLDRDHPDWHQWESSSGRRFLHGGPGAFMFVPENTPHAFANPTSGPVRMFFQSSVPGGHENYFDELMHLLRRSDGKPDPKDVAALRRRYDIEQLTPLSAAPPPADAPVEHEQHHD
jgi:oxalate decarboxylase/phosphoglucose isomerase-like protein (cupin superfamily)